MHDYSVYIYYVNLTKVILTYTQYTHIIVICVSNRLSVKTVKVNLEKINYACVVLIY